MRAHAPTDDSSCETDLTKSDFVRARMVLGSLLAALIIAKAVLLSRDGMVASTTHRTRVSGLFRYLVTSSVVALAYSSGKVWMPGRSTSSKVGMSVCIQVHSAISS